jgi:hypothetical protein
MIRADSVPDDGLPTSEVGPWSLQKYRLLDLYNTLFSTGMKHHWDLRVYIDLFSGPGRARVRKTERVVESSPIIALRVPDPFDRYIFLAFFPKHPRGYEFWNQVLKYGTDQLSLFE